METATVLADSSVLRDITSKAFHVFVWNERDTLKEDQCHI